MRKITTVVAAFIASATLPLVAIAPATAAPFDFSTVTINCQDYDPYENNWANHPLFDTNSVTVTLVDCQDFVLYDNADTDNGSTSGGYITSGPGYTVNNSSEEITVDGDFDLELLYQDGDGFTIHFYTPSQLPDPDSGVYLARGNQQIGLTPDQFTIPGDPEAIHAFGDGDGCDMVTGDHAFTYQRISITKAGTYTFRLVSTDPQSSYLKADADYTPTQDTFLALTGDFDKANPEADVYACDDDLWGTTIDGTDQDMPAYTTAEGDLYERHQPYLTADLQPGNYTILFTFWGHISASNWADGSTNGVYGDDWTPTAATFNFDVWGPEGGASLVDEFPDLATTGVDPTFGLWAGLSLVGTGAAIAVARRRAVRA